MVVNHGPDADVYEEVAELSGADFLTSQLVSFRRFQKGVSDFALELILGAGTANLGYRGDECLVEMLCDLISALDLGRIGSGLLEPLLDPPRQLSQSLL